MRLSELGELSGAALAPGADGTRLLTDVASLDAAGPSDLSFFDNPLYLAAFQATRAGACIVASKHAAAGPAGTALLLSEEPYKAYARAARAFYPLPALRPGVHPSAIVDATARLGDGCELAAGVVIEAGAEIGARCQIGANSVVGRNVVVGEDCRIGALVSLGYCLVGARVTMHPGVRIGQDGFGFAPDPAGHVKVPQLGRVLIEDDCDIGANTTIDRGAGPDTVIGAGSFIDNLVQIGHNVQLGRGCIVVAQSGISGSTRLGDFVAIGGQAGLIGHLRIGSGARIAAKAGVMNDIPPGEVWSGSPACPVREHFRRVAVLRRLAQQRGKSE